MQSIKLYEKYKEGRHWDAHPIEYAERFADFLKKKDFQGLLVDIGCGRGRDVKIFNEKGFKVTGIDTSKEIIDAAQDYCRECAFEQQDAEDLQFGDEEVGAFYMINVIHYVDEKKAISEIYRSLVPGGYLFIHFNLLIADDEGNVDYQRDEDNILQLLNNFKIIDKRIFSRHDARPKPHKHEILELILQK